MLFLYNSSIYIDLEFEHLILGVSQLLEDPTHRALLRAILLPRDRVDLSRRTCLSSHTHTHTPISRNQLPVPGERERDTARRARRTTYEHFDLLAAFGGRHVRADELAADVPRRAGPTRGGLIERVHDAERVRVRALERGELVAEEDVRL